VDRFKSAANEVQINDDVFRESRRCTANCVEEVSGGDSERFHTISTTILCRRIPGASNVEVLAIFRTIRTWRCSWWKHEMVKVLHGLDGSNNCASVVPHKHGAFEGTDSVVSP